MLRKGAISLLPALVLAFGGVRGAVAQSEIDALVMWDERSSDRLAQGCRDLGYNLKEARSNEAAFIDYLNSQSWNFIGIELPWDTITQKETVAQLLEDHVAAGGALVVNYNHLNEWPRLQKLLGVETTSPVAPMQDILASTPLHCIWFGATQITYRFAGHPPDPGDILTPGVESVVLGEFSTGGAAILLRNGKRVIVNGFDFGSYGASFLAKQQVAYLMECQADFDQTTGWGVLDIFDFLRFQEAFVKQWPCANIRYDASFDIFDFLAFQDAFVSGCE